MCVGAVLGMCACMSLSAGSGYLGTWEYIPHFLPGQQEERLLCKDQDHKALTKLEHIEATKKRSFFFFNGWCGG